MKLRPRHAVLAGALAAIAVVLPLSGSAQANTTLPGQNGKIAFTTNADTFTEFEDAADTRGAVKCPIFAPLGAEVGFGFDVLFCGAEIATINPDGSGFAQLTSDTFPDDKPAWLPRDGSKIAFQSTLHDSDCVEKSPFCGYNLYDMGPDGSSVRQLTTTHDPTAEPGLFNSSSASYSPDGSQIAFEALNELFFTQGTLRDVPEDPLFKQFNHFFQTIYTIPSGGESAGAATPLIPETDYENKGELISDSQPTFSPDGTKIAFVRLTINDVELAAENRGVPIASISSSIYTVPATGGEPTPVESIDACQEPIDVIKLMVGQAAGAPPIGPGRGLIGGDTCTFDAAPAWSPDGSKLAVERITFPSGLLFDRSATRGLPEIFEDSDIVTFNSTDGSGETDVSDVTEPADCATLDSLKSGVSCGTEQKPAWSPDGTKIAFFSDRNNDGVFPVEACEQLSGAQTKGFTGTDCDDEIWTVNADGSSPAQVTNNDVNDINPDWQSIPNPTPPPPAPPVVPATKPKVSVAGVRSACVAKTFHVRFRVTTASSVKSVVVKLDGKRIKSTSKGGFTLAINGKKLKSGRHRLTITATDSNGNVTTTHKSFSVCKAAKPRRKAAPRFTG
ncbi:MAG TPA: Ig-like domain-containing protein [Thermoleophilaceae bacterium]